MKMFRSAPWRSVIKFRFPAVVVALGMWLVPDLLRGGDILRGGASAGSSRQQSSSARNNAGAEAAAAAQTRAQDRLARTTKAIADMRALQSAARAAAGDGGVPDGLVVNGLDPIAPGQVSYRWEGATAPTQSGNDVTITQNLQQAILHWRTFNVGKNTRVRFDQSAGGIDSSKWVAFNKIYDPSGRPSQIRGQIKADGQVYIINQNGIIFGAGSQVNARGLVASALPINDNLVTRGLLNNPDAQFLFSADAIPARVSNATMPAFNPPTPLTADGRTGDVVVERGAELTAPTTSENVGGRITLIGANVRNEGSISTPDGQTILAAGLQVGFAAHPSTDPTLRGLDVYVGNVAYAAGGTQPTAGTVTNSGIIDIPRASATLIGKTVQQLGVINSSTTTALNGRVDLLANYGSTSNSQFTSESNLNITPLFIQRASGNVEIGAGSVIQILPDISAGDKVPGAALSLPSLINEQGLSVRLGKDSIFLAPGASLPSGLNAVIPRDGSRLAASENLEAGVSIKAGTWISTSALSSTWAYSGGQVYFEPGATVSVAGSVNVSVPLSQNLLTVQLRGAELANSPLQRTGAVRGASITVDARRTGTYNGQSWSGTPLGDVSGYVGLIERGVDQLTVAGGSVHLGAGEAVIMQRGSTVDVSGGWMRNEGGRVKTTRLLEKGRLVDIEDATPDRIYDGIYTGQTSQTSTKWGVTRTYNLSLAPLREYTEPSHIQGGDAGSISIVAPSVALDGDLIGQAVQGPRQSNETTLALAKSGTLNIRFQAADPVTPNFNISPTPPRVVFDSSAKLPEAAAFAFAADGTPEPLAAIRKADVVLSPSLLTESGFGTLVVENNDGTISIPIGTRVETPILGSITLAAANIDIDGTVTAPGGNLSFKASNISPFLAIKLENDATRPPTPAVAPDRGVFYLGRNAMLSTAGLVTDYRPGSSGVRDRPPLVDAGSISINAFNVNLSTGSSIDVSGGVSISATGARTFGAAGSLEIKAGTDPRLTWLLGGRLVLGATLSGYSGSGNGGSLSIQAPLIQIGGTLPTPELVPGAAQPIYRFGALVVERDEILHLDPEFFSQGGFTDFTLSAIGKTISFEAGQFLPAISIADNTVIKPVAKAWQTVDNGDGPMTLEPFVQPDGIREPVNLTFSTSVTQDIFEAVPRNLVRGDIVLGKGALIDADPGASVSIRGGTVAILGSIRAPGGSISITGANSFPSEVPSLPSPQFNKALPTVHIGPRSVISTAGLVQLTPDPYGRRTGSVLPGGTIKVSGNIVAEAGAVLDVSGASGVLDLRPEALAANIPNSVGAAGDRVVPVNSGVTAPLYSRRTVPTVVESDAGSITLSGGQELFSDATLRGFAGGPSARGGSLTISSGRFYDSTDASIRPSLTDVVLVVKQSGPTIAGAFYQPGETAIGKLVPVAVGDANQGRGHFAADSFLQGGFDSLTLSGTLEGAVGFSGDVSISARRSLSVAEGGVIFADANVSLAAPYVALGRTLQSPVQMTDPNQTTALLFSQPVYPLFGPGTLTVRAKLIDMGDLSLQNIGRATFIADGGDIRGSGTLNVAGAIEMRSGQIYPTTASRFTIVAYDPNISVAASSTTSPVVTLASAVLPAGFGPGSPLLGSRVVAVNGATVTLASNANLTIGGAT
ncbi:MAG: filamentous hemagglutinin N-terminal domain-containing protein, partial [Terrimicrobiaceae bacterium]